MCTVFLRHHLGRRGCGPKRFRHNGKKGIVVDYRIGALYRLYHLFDIRIQKREKNWAADIADCAQTGLAMNNGQHIALRIYKLGASPELECRHAGIIQY